MSRAIIMAAALAAVANGGCATVMMAALGGAACGGDGQCARSALSAGMAIDGAILASAAHARRRRGATDAPASPAGKREAAMDADYVCHDASGASASYYDAPSLVFARTACLEQHGLAFADPESLDRGCRCRRVRLTDVVSPPPAAPSPVTAGGVAPVPPIGAGRALEPPRPPFYAAEEDVGRVYECLDGLGHASVYVTAWTPGEARTSCAVRRGITATDGAAILRQCRCRAAEP